MSLPGKLCIGILEEDNPQKSYFRFKPLMVAEENGFTYYDVGDEFPENGCIRIVPDKNESSRFKARMRRMGRFCSIDLREHPEENDKIRPNKNYRGDDSETNAYIIYSDVVRDAPAGLIAQIVPQDVSAESERVALNVQTPYTERVVFAGYEPFGTLWAHAPIEDIEGGTAFTRTPEAAREGEYSRFDVPGFGGETLSFIISVPGKLLYENDAPEQIPEIPAPVERAIEIAPAVKPMPAPAPAEPVRPAPAEPKPWLFHDDSIVPRPVDSRMALKDQAMAMQTGLNPRRGRSLQEIIEDKWRRSRIDQLGHPVPGSVTGKPVTSPVDTALDAVSAAWNHVSARATLCQALSQVEGLGAAITGGEDERKAAERAETLRDYETRKDALAGEIEEYSVKRDELKAALLDEMRRENSAEIEKLQARISELDAREAEIRARAEDSKRIADEAERDIIGLTDAKLTERLAEFAINCRAADLLAGIKEGKLRKKSAPVAVSRVEGAKAEDIISRVSDYFSDAAYPMTHDAIVNLLACFTLGDYMLITGPSGCGKTMCAKLLAESLGLRAAGRVADYDARGKRAGAPAFASDADDLMGFVLADDINTSPEVGAAIIPNFENLTGVKLVMTAQDSGAGYPLGTRILDRAFMVRLRNESADSRWDRPLCRSVKAEGVITAADLNAMFSAEGRSVSPQVMRRLADLRAAFARYGLYISRRTLNALWQYCAAVTPLLGISPIEAFDLAFAQRALPTLVSLAGVEALHALPALLSGLPRSQELLRQPLAIEI